MSNKNQDQRPRSKSKRKGINVSLTPSRKQSNKDDSSCQISRLTVLPIRQLPVIHYQGSYSHENRYKTKFTYHSPIPEVKNIVQSESVIAGQIMHKITNLPIGQLAYNTSYGQPQKTTSSPKTDYKIMSPSQKVSKITNHQSIRPQVFTIVEEISNKVSESASKSYNKAYKMSENDQKFIKAEQAENKHPSPVLISHFVQKQLGEIAEKSNETFQSQQASKSQQICQDSKILSKVKESTLNIIKRVQNSPQSAHNPASNHKPRNIQNLKLAEQKLINIIKVCENGL